MSFDVAPSLDDGYVLAGISTSLESELCVVKLNCQSEVDWAKNLGVTSLQADANCKVIVLPDNDIVFLGNVVNGAENDVNILVARLTSSGDLLWEFEYGSEGNDIANDITLLNDGGFVIGGETRSIGNDISSLEHEDMLLFKIAPSGELQWSRSYGVEGTAESIKAITLDPTDLSIVACGSMNVNTFEYSFLLKINSLGNQIWLRAIGAENHSSYATDIEIDPAGNYLMCGASTNLGMDSESTTDPFFFKLDAISGDTIATKIIKPLGEFDDRATSILSYENGSYQISIETESFESYNTSDNHNKAAIISIDSDFEISSIDLINTEGAADISIHKSDDSILIIGNNDQYSGNNEPQAQFIKANEGFSFSGGCTAYQITEEVLMAYDFWNVTEPAVDESLGLASTVINSISDSPIQVSSIQCETIPSIEAAFTNNQSCVGSSILFEDQSIIDNPTEWLWDLGNGEMGLGQNFTTIYNDPGNYDVELVVSDGCYADSITQSITILEEFDIDIGVDSTIIIGQSVMIGGNPTGPIDAVYIWQPFQWLNNNTLQNPTASPEETTQFHLTVMDVNGCIKSDSIMVYVEEIPEEEVLNSPFVPNVFSPNNDQLNDELFVYGEELSSFDFSVFNRSGQLVFTSSDPSEKWNGYFQTEPAPLGVYYYVVRGSDMNGKEHLLKGNVTLVR